MNRSLDAGSDEDEPRNLTDYESAQHTALLQRLVAESEARVEARFEVFQKLFVECLGECFSKERRKIRDEMKKHIEDLVAKMRTGPVGPRGERGARGEYGAERN